MGTQKQIRVIALGLIQDGDRLFVAEGYDSTKQRHFYRALGGGVEFGESSLKALKREFQEEIQAELINIEYLACIENCFTYADQPYHEIVQLYRCDFRDRHFYQLSELTFMDGINEPVLARWVNCDRLRSGDLWLVPTECLNYLR